MTDTPISWRDLKPDPITQARMEERAMIVKWLREAANREPWDYRAALEAVEALPLEPAPSEGGGSARGTTARPTVDAQYAPSPWRPIPLNDETVRYVSRYGGMCRDCADNFGVCPNSGLPCGDEHDKAIRHVIRALNYGFGHGFIPTPTEGDA